MQELSRDFDALGRNARLAKLARLSGQGVDLERCEVFIDETCEDVRRLLEYDSSVTCRCLRELAAAQTLYADDGLTPSMRKMSFDCYRPRTPSQSQALADCQAYAVAVAEGFAVRPGSSCTARGGRQDASGGLDYAGGRWCIPGVMAVHSGRAARQRQSAPMSPIRSTSRSNCTGPDFWWSTTSTRTSTPPGTASTVPGGE